MTQSDARAFPLSFVVAPASVSQTFGIVAVLTLRCSVTIKLVHRKLRETSLQEANHLRLATELSFTASNNDNLRRGVTESKFTLWSRCREIAVAAFAPGSNGIVKLS